MYNPSYGGPDQSPDPYEPPSPMSATPWWQDPSTRPAGYTGPWPPPLPPGTHYGPTPGSIEADSPGSAQVPPITPGQSPDYHPDWWGNAPPAPPSPPPPPPPTPPIGQGPLTAPFNQVFNAPSPINLGGPTGIPYIPPIPTFTPPTYTPPPAFSYAEYAPSAPFVGPTAQSALSDPGYQFRASEGQRALEQSAAARGLLNTGGTLKDLLNYGQNLASQEYQNVWDRAFNTYGMNEANRFNTYRTNREGAVNAYNTNYQTQYVDPYKNAYQGAMDIYAPKLQQWITQGSAGQRQSELDYDRSWQQFLQNFRQFQDQRDSTWDKLFKLQTI